MQGHKATTFCFHNETFSVKVVLSTDATSWVFFNTLFSILCFKINIFLKMCVFQSCLQIKLLYNMHLHEVLHFNVWSPLLCTDHHHGPVLKKWRHKKSCLYLPIDQILCVAIHFKLDCLWCMWGKQHYCT